MIIFVVSGRKGAVGFYGVRDIGFQAFRVVGSVGLGSSRLLGLVPQELQCGCANSEFCALCCAVLIFCRTWSTRLLKMVMLLARAALLSHL